VIKNVEVDEKDVAAGADGQINPAHRPFQGGAVSEGLRGVKAFLKAEMSGFFRPAAAGDYLLTSGRFQINVS
jgi:hypothetical protein